MSSPNPRVAVIQNFLHQLSVIHTLRLNFRPEKLFEVESYLRTANRLVGRNKQAVAHNLFGGNFRVLFNPGSMANSSYLQFIDTNGGDDMYLFMNCEVEGSSGVFHCPDITLKIGRISGDIYSIYECKHYSNTLGIGVYREFIGYLMELGLRHNGPAARKQFRALPDMSPRIYTSARALVIHQQMADDYGFTVEDRL